MDLFKLSQGSSAKYWVTLDQSYLFGSPLQLDSSEMNIAIATTVSGPRLLVMMTVYI